MYVEVGQNMAKSETMDMERAEANVADARAMLNEDTRGIAFHWLQLVAFAVLAALGLYTTELVMGWLL